MLRINELTSTKTMIEIQLNRPEKRNALDGPMVHALTTQLAHYAKDTALRLLVFSAAGHDFCAGADIAWMQQLATKSEAENIADALALARLFHAISTFPCPVMVLAQGAVLGGGMGIVCAADIVVASTDTFFRFPEVGMGVCPSVVSPWVVRVMGESVARYYFLTTEKITAEQAYSLGILHKIVPYAALKTTGLALANSMLNYSQYALSESKLLVNRLANQQFSEDILQMTAEHLAMMRRSKDAQERMLAFIKK